MKNKLKLSIGVIITIVIIYAIFRIFPIEIFISEIREANYFFVFFGIVAYMSAHLVNSLRWRDILIANDFRSVRIFSLFKIITMSTMLNSVLPARIGEVAKAVFLVKKEKTPMGTAFVTVVSERFLDLIIVIILLSLPVVILGLYPQLESRFSQITSKIIDLLTESLPYLKQYTEFINYMKSSNFINFIIYPFLTLLGLIALGIITILVFRKNYSGLVALLKKILFWVSDENPLFEKITIFFSQMKFFSHPRQVLEIFFYTLLVWLAYAVSYYFFILAFDIKINPLSILFILGVSGLSVSIPAAPGGFGTYEFGFLVATALVLEQQWNDETQLASILSCALILHTSHILSVSITGLYFFMKENITLKEITESKS